MSSRARRATFGFSSSTTRTLADDGVRLFTACETVFAVRPASAGEISRDECWQRSSVDRLRDVAVASGLDRALFIALHGIRHHPAWLPAEEDAIDGILIVVSSEGLCSVSLLDYTGARRLHEVMA
jgi:hypothetical protein